MTAAEELRNHLTEVVTAALPEGFTFDPDVSTGGGCEAMVATAPDGRQVYLTDGDACRPFDSPDDPEYGRSIVCSYYDADGDYDGTCSWEGGTDADLDDNNITATITSWVQDDPYRDEN